MSLTGDRDAIAQALSTVDDVTGYAYRPTTPRPGDAWPLLSGLERDQGFTFMVTWRVLVFLPQDEVDASKWIDAHFESLVEALEPKGFVESLVPVNLGADSQQQYGLQITMRGE